MVLALNLTKMKEEQWERFYELLKNNYSHESLSIEWLCKKAGISRMHLHRIIREKSGLSTSHFIRQFRLEKAVELLEEKEKTISEIAYDVGFKDPNYFTRCFVEVYGLTPSEYS